MKTPMTVAQLAKYLTEFPPDTVVMIDCEDDYYSGPLELDDLSIGYAVLTDPYDWQKPPYDEHGIRREPKTVRYPGGWNLAERWDRPFSERRPCLVIRCES